MTVFDVINNFDKKDIFVPSQYAHQSIEHFVKTWEDLNPAKQDEFLMLFQDCPVQVAVGSYYANNLPAEIRQMSPLQQVAMICFYNCYKSFVLPYLVYTDIVQELEDDWSNYADLKESFMDEVCDYLHEKDEENGMTTKAARKSTNDYLMRLSDNVDTLVRFIIAP